MSATDVMQLPDGWEWCTLADVAEVRLGRQRSPKNHTGPNMVPYLRAANVTWSGLDLSDVKEMQFSADEVVTYALELGDILVAEASGSASEVGKPAIWRGEIETACFQNTLIRVRSEGPLPDYLMLVLREAAISGRFAKASLGVGINHLCRERLASWKIALPPLEEQKRIVERAASLVSLVEAGAEGVAAGARYLERMRASVLAAAVMGRLCPTSGDAVSLLETIVEERRAQWEAEQLATMEQTGRTPRDDKWMLKYKDPAPPIPRRDIDLPEGWTWATVDQLATRIQYGTSAKSGAGGSNGDVPVLRMGNIVEGELTLRDLKYLPADHADFPELLLEPGDMLFTRTNGSVALVGKSAVYRGKPAPCAYASYLIRVRCSKRFVPEFLAYFLNSPLGRAWAADVNSQVGQANINSTKLRSLTIPLPPFETQERILATVGRQLAQIDQLAGDVAQARAAGAALIRSLLQRATSGDLAGQDSSDEPAATLVATVAAARAARAAARKTDQRTKATRASIRAGAR
jgi:type I restriction enzyme S subunit